MKKVSIANFNLVFSGEENEEPLLSRFDTIVMPALTSGIVKGGKGDDTKYFLMNVEVDKSNSEEYVLRGLIVKKTVLEVKSDIDQNGKLVEKDERYPAAPFSMFVIYLKNHRMVYVENQKGSPNLASFRATVRYIIEEYMRRLGRESDEELKLPIPILNVVGIPMREKMEEALKNVDKIKLLRLRFFPLNGDIDYSEIFGGISNDVRKEMGSNNAELLIRSPKNVQGVIEVINKSGGTVEPIFEVSYNDTKTGKKRSGRIKKDQISETMSWELPEGNMDDDFTKITENGRELKSISYTSENNNYIYESNKSRIMKFVRRG